jgi:hypothetical protein
MQVGDGVAVLIAPAVHKADEISRPAEATPLALGAATSLVIALALYGRSASTPPRHRRQLEVTPDPPAKTARRALAELIALTG